ncbi:MAG: GGDEF domain-containing protein [Pirellulaceae bacterium]
MGTFVFYIAFVAIGALIGAAAGWLLRGGGTSKPVHISDESASAPTTPQSKTAKDEKQKLSAAEAILARLHQMTESVAADVGEHHTRVQEINNELTASGDEAGVVFALEKLIKVNEAMQTQLRSSEERLQSQAQEIESHIKEARTDALTKLANRRAFDDEIARCVEEIKRSGRPSCVMMIDVDHFKKFNDTYGHQAGDEVLRGVARVLRRSLRGKETVCRYGGEEFVVIFPNSDIGSAKPAAERARASIADEVFEFRGLDLKVTASGGVAELQPGETGDELVKRADDALYVSKENGRDCGYCHNGTTSHAITVKEETTKPVETEDDTVFVMDEPETPVSGRHDTINGLSDRKSFYSDVDRRVSEWKRGGSPLSVLLAEVDRFQQIEEEFGEKAGEVVLRAAAQFLKASMREMDHISQFDDSLFAILLPGAGITEASAASERIRTDIERCKLLVHGERLTFTVSLGSAEIATGEERDDLVTRAQASLDAARVSGGNCCYSTTKDGECRAMALSY